MTTEEFNNLKHGNVLRTEFGDLGVVSQVVRDVEGKVQFVGWVPAFDIHQASSIQIVSDSYVETFFSGRTVRP